ncbi:malonyl-ACP O-methyltransferase BioC [Silvimonas amylolytica]|uniref:Malonyl-[acyl-carrier protein] O-methyltransferase n=1 Tax=Silvimonas amylolytica TaxID=449663 RepID=A0ABQ2PLE2_9NEIS|nr:malonyl-ACP O-methyltransferase BioC [Silvimonas amylolytica]GGP26185.1 malonyl-[acyl-carrier protein] O-methyltransferase 1 [Silvimonas amylolytica]
MSEAFYTDKAAVRAAFDKAASTYDAAAVLQREVVQRMAERLEFIRIKPERVLDAGSGTGFACPVLRERYPESRLIELDLAPSMLRVARDGRAGGIRALFDRRKPVQVCGDLEALPLASNSVDLIWSSLALQWCNEPDTAFGEMLRVLKPGGLLMFATLGPDTLRELRAAFAGVDGHTHVNQFIDMHDLGDALVNSGFATPVMDMEHITLTYPELKPILADLKAIGAQNATRGRRDGMMGKTAWQRITAAYEAFRRDGELPATYEVVYGHAWKPDTAPGKKLADGSQVIEFRPRVR